MHTQRKVSELLASAVILRGLQRSQLAATVVPARLLLVLNKTCNSRCRYCHIWRQQQPGTLTVDDYAQLARSVPQLSWLGLTGGEPMQREDLIEIVGVFRESCPQLRMINLTTNGLHEERTLEVVNAINVRGPELLYVNVSIDGPPEVHDRLRGVEGNFERSLSLLKKLRTISHVRAGVSFTFFPENLALLDKTVAAIQERIPDFKRSSLSVNLGQASSHYYGTDDIKVVDREQLAQSLRRELQLTRALEGGGQGLLKRAYLKQALGYIARGHSQVACSAVRTNVYISETGEVFPCHTWGRSLGQLADHAFQLDQLLASAVVTQTMQEIRAQKCPGCWSPCQAYPSLLAQPRTLLGYA